MNFKNFKNKYGIFNDYNDKYRQQTREIPRTILFPEVTPKL